MLHLSGCVIIFSIAYFKRNKHYRKVWTKRLFKEKVALLTLLVFHNVLFFTIYATLPFLAFYYKELAGHYFLMYLGILIGIILHSVTNNNQCWSTVKQNELLEIDKYAGFRDFYAIIFNVYSVDAGKMGLRGKVYYGYLITAMLVTTGKRL